MTFEWRIYIFDHSDVSLNIEDHLERYIFSLNLIFNDHRDHET